MRIKQIEIQNYKAFKDAERIEVDGKNLLVYGNNGSGKSSLYLALYALLRSSTNSSVENQQFFDRANPCCNANIFSDQNLPSYIRIVVGDEAGEKTYEFSPQGNTAGDTIIELANMASDFMNYRLLLSFYNFRGTEEADIFPIFLNEFFPYWTDRVRKISFSAWYDQIHAELRQLEFEKVRKNSRRYIDFLPEIDAFNQALDRQIMSLIETTNDYLQVYFLPDEPLEVSIQGTGLQLVEKWKLGDPFIHLKLKYDGNPIERPHTFLNEARLSAIALSVRFAAFDTRLKASDLKILVLDDLLISLDMSIRMQLIDTIVGQFSDYQIIIMTHDKRFFDVIKQNLLPQADWRNLEFYENRINGRFANPIILPNDDALAKAEAALQQKNYESCAVNLRKKAEELIRIYFDPTLENLSRFEVLGKLANALAGVEKEQKTKLFNQFVRLIENDSFTSSQVAKLKAEGFRGDGMPDEEVGQINHLRTQVMEFLEAYYAVRDTERDKREKLMIAARKVNEIRGRVLNIGAHHADEQLYEDELKDAIETMRQFEQEVKNSIQQQDQN